jgi:ATP sulfurylase
MKSFKTFIKEKEVKTLVTTFGRNNPPHIGHAVNFKELAAAAKKGAKQNMGEELLIMNY